MSSYFDVLNQLDVSEHIEKKGQFNYLSWTWAVEQLGKHHPEAVIKTKTDEHGFPAFYSPDGQAMVWVTVEIDNVVRGQPYPVLDYKNKPVDNPDVFVINTSLQRALVKAISLHGLGLYIYAGEDLPMDAPIFTAEQKKEFDFTIDSGTPYEHWMFMQTLDDKQKIALFNSFEKGEITAKKKLARELEANGAEIYRDLVDKLIEHIDNGDTGGMHEIGEELGGAKALAFRSLSVDLQNKARELK